MSHYQILIVEDEELVRKALQRLLMRDGYTVLSAPDAEEALSILDKQEVDIVISDHLMPGMKGLEFMEVVRKRRPDALRIILTAFAETDMVIEAINRGEVYRFLTKPWNDADLRLTVRLALRHLDLERQYQDLIKRFKAQEEMIRALETKYPGITEVKRDSEGAIVIS